MVACARWLYKRIIYKIFYSYVQLFHLKNLGFLCTVTKILNNFAVESLQGWRPFKAFFYPSRRWNIKLIVCTLTLTGSSIITQNLIPLISQSFLAGANPRGGLPPPGGGEVKPLNASVWQEDITKVYTIYCLNAFQFYVWGVPRSGI